MAWFQAFREFPVHQILAQSIRPSLSPVKGGLVSDSCADYVMLWMWLSCRKKDEMASANPDLHFNSTTVRTFFPSIIPFNWIACQFCGHCIMHLHIYERKLHKNTLNVTAVPVTKTKETWTQACQELVQSQPCEFFTHKVLHVIPSPSSWMAVTSLPYSSLTSSVPNGRCR
jgi:hypothetical protein